VTVTQRELNRATLARQLLLERTQDTVPAVVQRIVAIQAQEPASPYLALWNRIADLDPAAVDAAFGDHSVVKSSLLRLTLHAVHEDDHPAFYDAMLPSLRASRLNDRRFTDTGLTADDLESLIPTLRQFLQEPRSKDEIEGFLADRLGHHQPRAWWALRTYAPLHHSPTGGPWAFGPTGRFTAAPDREPVPHPEAVRVTMLRYLEGFGPASLRDVAQFTMLRTPVLQEAVEALGDRLVTLVGPDGSELFDVPDGPCPPGDTPAPARLLPMWDSILLAYADRSRIIPPDLRPEVIRRNGDVLPTVLVDGYVAGVWRPVDSGIEVTALHPIDDHAWSQLDDEARALSTFLANRDQNVYGRYARWWGSLPNAATRVLAD
jgi:hypothetical protein